MMSNGLVEKAVEAIRVHARTNGVPEAAGECLEKAIRAVVRDELASMPKGKEKDVEGGGRETAATSALVNAALAMRGARSDRDKAAGLEMECESLRGAVAEIRSVLARERAQAEATIRELRARIDELEGDRREAATDRDVAAENLNKARAELETALQERDEAQRAHAAANEEVRRLRQELELEKQQYAAKCSEARRALGGW